MGGRGRGVLNPPEPEEIRALLLLRLLPGVGDLRGARLLTRYGSARAAMAAPSRDFARLAGKRGAAARKDPRLLREVDRVLARCRSQGIRVAARGDPFYPASLHHLVDPPPVLFLRGDPILLRLPSVTVVGSRKATPTGRRTARRLGTEISARDVPVVSGLALGIDAAAHRGAVDGPGGTVAVLGCGADVVHPPGNRKLFFRILERGLLVSEFLPGEAVRAHHFPRRNRILAALSDTVVVVEAARKSGALITVDHALDMGREVFAVPGNVEAPQSQGTNRLLLDGAGPVTSVRELENAIRWSWRKWAEEPGRVPGSPQAKKRSGSGTNFPRDRRPPSARAGTPGSAAVPGSSAILSLLGVEPRSVEHLVVEAGLPAPRVLTLLTELELAGAARREGEGWCRAPGATPD